MSKEYKADGNKRKLIDLLWDLPYSHDPEYDIPNNQSNGILAVMQAAENKNCVDEFINIVEKNPDTDFDEMLDILLADYAVEYVDEID